MMSMDILNAKLAPTLKRVAKNVADIVKQKDKISKTIEKLEADFETKKAALQADYNSLVQQQELFEAPVRELTGGYGTEDLVTTEVIETGVGKNGKPTYSTRFVMKYPETILPPTEGEKPKDPVVQEVSSEQMSFADVDDDLPFKE